MKGPTHNVQRQVPTSNPATLFSERFPLRPSLYRLRPPASFLKSRSLQGLSHSMCWGLTAVVLLHHTQAASQRGDPRRESSDLILLNIYLPHSHTFVASLSGIGKGQITIHNPGTDPHKLFLKHFPEAGKSNQRQSLGKPCVDVKFWFRINMVAKLSMDLCFLWIFSKLVLKHRRTYNKMLCHTTFLPH